MAILESDLLLEVGSEAIADLSAAEKAAILAKYSVANIKVAAMKTFYVLALKYKPSYKMGSAFEELSSKYRRYWEIYCHLAATVGAGKLAVDVDELEDDTYNIERYKWPGQTRA